MTYDVPEWNEMPLQEVIDSAWKLGMPKLYFYQATVGYCVCFDEESCMIYNKKRKEEGVEGRARRRGKGNRRGNGKEKGKDKEGQTFVIRRYISPNKIHPDTMQKKPITLFCKYFPRGVVITFFQPLASFRDSWAGITHVKQKIPVRQGVSAPTEFFFFFFHTCLTSIRTTGLEHLHQVARRARRM